MSEVSPIYHRDVGPCVEDILLSPNASFWLKDALRAALERDPAEAAKDAELLAAVLAGRCKGLVVSTALR